MRVVRISKGTGETIIRKQCHEQQNAEGDWLGEGNVYPVPLTSRVQILSSLVNYPLCLI